MNQNSKRLDRIDIIHRLIHDPLDLFRPFISCFCHFLDLSTVEALDRSAESVHNDLDRQKCQKQDQTGRAGRFVHKIISPL